jgi:hypothetical protein
MPEETVKKDPPIPKSIVIGDFSLTTIRSSGQLWIQNADGEGMETSPAKFQKAIEAFWKEEF